MGKRSPILISVRASNLLKAAYKNYSLKTLFWATDTNA